MNEPIRCHEVVTILKKAFSFQEVNANGDVDRTRENTVIQIERQMNTKSASSYDSMVSGYYGVAGGSLSSSPMRASSLMAHHHHHYAHAHSGSVGMPYVMTGPPPSTAMGMGMGMTAPSMHGYHSHYHGASGHSAATAAAMAAAYGLPAYGMPSTAATAPSSVALSSMPSVPMRMPPMSMPPMTSGSASSGLGATSGLSSTTMTMSQPSAYGVASGYHMHHSTY